MNRQLSQESPDELGGVAAAVEPEPHRPEKAVKEDYELVEFRVPYFEVFDLGDGSDDPTYQQAQKQYEQILQSIEEGTFERISSTGAWGADGHYRVQVHYYGVYVDEVLKEEESTDYDTGVGGEDEVTKERTEEERTKERHNAVVASDSLPK